MKKVIYTILPVLFFIVVLFTAQGFVIPHFSQLQPFADTVNTKELTISYQINVTNGARKARVTDTYDGGKKTVFISSNQARVRMVALMRTQSMFLYPVQNGQVATVVKESGIDKYKFALSSDHYKHYNNKYDGASFEVKDTKEEIILGYACKKAELTLKSGEKLTLYYTDLIKNDFFKETEPFLKEVPGVVLRYVYTKGRNRIVYEADDISFLPVNKNVFKIPHSGYRIKKYIPGQAPVDVTDMLKEEDNDDEDDDDEEEGV